MNSNRPYTELQAKNINFHSYEYKALYGYEYEALYGYEYEALYGYEYKALYRYANDVLYSYAYTSCGLKSLEVIK